MPIINTLLTLTDKMTPAFKWVADGVEKQKKRINTSFSGIENKAKDIESSFNSMRSTSITSMSGIISTIDKVKTALAAGETGAAKYATAFALIGGGAVAAAAGIMSAVNSSAEYVRSLRQVSNASGVSIEYLQKMAKAFNDTGLSIEKYGDLNKDTLDHLGDAYRDGSGPADDMKANGLKLKEYNKYLTETDGGIKALIHTYFELRKAGKNNAVITNQMETLASDSSHLVTTLKEFKTEQDALNSIQNQSAGVTAEVAAKYKEWDNKMGLLKTSLDEWKVKTLVPIIDQLNDLMDLLNGDWDKTTFYKTFAKEGAAGLVKDYVKNMNVLMPGFDTLKKTVISPLLEKAFPTPAAEPTMDVSAPAQVKDDNKHPWEKEKKASGGEDKAKAARDWLSSLDKSIASEDSKYDVQRQQELTKLAEFNKKKLLTKQQAAQAEILIDEQYKKGTDEAWYKKQEETLSAHHEAMLISEADYNTRMDEIKYGKLNTEADSAFQIELNRLKYEHETKLTEETDYQEKLQAIKDNYELKKKDLANNEASTKSKDAYSEQAESLTKYNNEVNRGIDLASGFADTIASSTEQGSAAWIAATVASKAMMVAQAIMAANLAGVMAAAETPGGPAAQAAAAENITMWGYAQAALIAAQGIVTVAGARAKGGGVEAGKTYLVGEKGPELFTTPGTGGQITSNANLQKALGSDNNASGGNSVFNQTVNITGSGISADDVAAIKAATESIVDKKLAQNNKKNS